MAPKRQMIGETLLAAGKLTPAQLEEALEKKQPGQRLGDYLLAQGIVAERDFMAALESQLNVRYVDVARITIDPELARAVPASLARRHTLAPVGRERGGLQVAMENPRNFAALEDLRVATRLEIIPVLAAKPAIEAALEKLYGSQLTERALADLKSDIDIDSLASGMESEGEAAAGAPVARLVGGILEQAVREGASDIHVEPGQGDVRVRMRVDGQLFTALTIPKAALGAVITRVKIMGGLNIAEKRLPQDGRFDFRAAGHDVDIRLSTLPTVHGEKAVLRLLDRNTFFIPKDRLGLTPENLEKFDRLLSIPYGMILVTGPTGAGKSTTLYTMLSEINRGRENIVTVEDPVEYTIEGLNQMQVNPKAGLDFATGLRAVLRQDPDIIMIGEIRDSETVQTAVRAAITGHLVLSTLHTNDAVSAVTRLADMGVPEYLVAAALAGVISQRLVRLICPQCRQPCEMPEREAERAGLEPGARAFRGVGCAHCGGTGYKGRMAVYEVVTIDAALRSMIHEKAPLDSLRAYVRERGVRSLRDECARLVAEGVVSPDQMLAVTT